MKLQHLFLLCGVTALTSLSTLAQAQAQQTSAPAASVDAQSASKEPVVKLYQALNEVQKASKNSNGQNTVILDQALNSSYDFPTILAKTVGYRYSSFNTQEKQDVLDAFKKYTAARYISSFTGGGDTQFKISPEVKSTTSPDRQIVNTTIGSGSDATQINYIVHKTAQGWQIVDVLLNGNISQTAIQHGDFSSTLAKGGSKALIDMLNQKTKSFSK